MVNGAYKLIKYFQEAIFLCIRIKTNEWELIILPFAHIDLEWGCFMGSLPPDEPSA